MVWHFFGNKSPADVEFVYGGIVQEPGFTEVNRIPSRHPSRILVNFANQY
jgi:hypothetical protein